MRSTHMQGASRGHLCDSTAFLLTFCRSCAATVN